MAANALPFLTPEQYLEIERAAEFKSEYHDGQMFAMSGGSLAHSFIPGGINFALRTVLRGTSCRVANSELRVRISPQGPFVYPDVTVVCGEPQLADDFKDTLLNPIVIFEVLSTSTEAYDRGDKFAYYRSIPSLREYVLVSQTRPRMEVFSKGVEGKWALSEFAGLNSMCRLESIDCEIPLSEVYVDISFDA